MYSIDMKSKIMVTKTTQIIKESIGADFIVAPLNRSMSWSNFKGTEEQLRNYIQRKYGREVEIVN